MKPDAINNEVVEMRRKCAILFLVLMAASLFCMTASAVQFRDVPAGYWANKEIAWAYDRGLMNGASETSFNPGGKTLRGQMTAILYRYAGSPAVEGNLAYSDVSSKQYYYNAALWAVQNKIMEDTRLVSDTMDAGEPISRAEFCTMLWKYSLYAGTYVEPDAQTAFTDLGNVGDTAVRAIEWANCSGIVNGTSPTTFNPNGTLSRAAAAAMLYRYENYVHPAGTQSGSTSASGSSQGASGGGSTATVPPQAETTGYLVWIPTNGGTKYHSKASCSKMIDPIQVSIETAKAYGYTACSKCF